MSFILSPSRTPRQANEFDSVAPARCGDNAFDTLLWGQMTSISTAIDDAGLHDPTVKIGMTELITLRAQFPTQLRLEDPTVAVQLAGCERRGPATTDQCERPSRLQ